MENEELIKAIFGETDFDAWHGQQLSVMMDAIKSHLEFLGYEVTVRRNSTILRATHPHKRDFSFYEVDGIVRMIETNIGKNREQSRREDFLEFVNQANMRTWVAHFILTDELNVIANVSYTGPYHKPLFGRLLEKWNTDLLSLLDGEGGSDFLQTVYTTSQVSY